VRGRFADHGHGRVELKDDKRPESVTDKVLGTSTAQVLLGGENFTFF
jgi:hypothetical protein